MEGGRPTPRPSAGAHGRVRDAEKMPIPQETPAEQRQGVGTALTSFPSPPRGWPGWNPAGEGPESPDPHPFPPESPPSQMAFRPRLPFRLRPSSLGRAPCGHPITRPVSPSQPAPFSLPPGAHARPGRPHLSPTLSLSEIHPTACLTPHYAPRIIFLHLVAGLANQYSRCSTTFELLITP